MNDEENKMYSNLADLLNKTLENGEIPKEFVQKEESSEESNEKIQKENEKNLIKNQNSQEKSFKIKIKNIKKKKTQEKKNYYKPMHFESLVLKEEPKTKKSIEKDERRDKKVTKEKVTLKERAKKTVDDAKKQGLMFINEVNHLKKKYDEKDGKTIEKFVLLASEGELGDLANLGKKEFIVDANENLKMANKDTYMDTLFAREHTIYNNVSEVSPFLRPYVVEKIKSQLGSSALKTTKGIFIDSDKSSSIRISNNKNIQNKIKENKTELKAYGYVKKTSVQFSDFNFHNAIGRADIVDIYLHPSGEISFYLIDTYDFNKNSTNPVVKGGYTNQIKGNL